MSAANRNVSPMQLKEALGELFAATEEAVVRARQRDEQDDPRHMHLEFVHESLRPALEQEMEEAESAGPSRASYHLASFAVRVVARANLPARDFKRIHDARGRLEGSLRSYPETVDRPQGQGGNDRELDEIARGVKNIEAGIGGIAAATGARDRELDEISLGVKDIVAGIGGIAAATGARDRELDEISLGVKDIVAGIGGLAAATGARDRELDEISLGVKDIVAGIGGLAVATGARDRELDEVARGVKNIEAGIGGIAAATGAAISNLLGLGSAPPRPEPPPRPIAFTLDELVSVDPLSYVESGDERIAFLLGADACVEKNEAALTAAWSIAISRSVDTVYLAVNPNVTQDQMIEIIRLRQSVISRIQQSPVLTGTSHGGA